MSAALEQSIRDYAADEHEVGPVIAARCGCGAEEFVLVYEDDEVGVAARVCVACDTETAIADSEERFDDVDELDQAQCTCDGEIFRAATGFALDADGEVRWVGVGLECVACGLAGVYVDWEIDYLPSRHLLEHA